MPTNDPEKRRKQYREYVAKPGVRDRRNAKVREWAKNNKDRIRANGKRRRLNERAKCLVATVRTRAKKRGLEFDLDQHVDAIQSRIDAGVCELTKEPFDLSPGRTFNSPSIDRIDPSRGYTIDNVRVVLNLVNVALGDWGEEILRGVMERWLK